MKNPIPATALALAAAALLLSLIPAATAWPWAAGAVHWCMWLAVVTGVPFAVRSLLNLRRRVAQRVSRYYWH